MGDCAAGRESSARRSVRRLRPWPSRKSATVCHEERRVVKGASFEITHPFHPARGNRFVLVSRKQNWGEDRVMYFDAHKRLRSVLASWTDVPEPDLFAQASGGHSWFRTDDLLRLRALVDDLLGARDVK
ncbi:DUF5372 family protein [Paraburkholderia dipogonis]|uniref:DUF5372 family protein n=1 Tax=Paraburkholderia dipogonis TaxID=1211383 RepID=UPI0038B77E94